MVPGANDGGLGAAVARVTSVDEELLVELGRVLPRHAERLPSPGPIPPHPLVGHVHQLARLVGEPNLLFGHSHRVPGSHRADQLDGLLGNVHGDAEGLGLGGELLERLAEGVLQLGVGGDGDPVPIFVDVGGLRLGEERGEAGVVDVAPRREVPGRDGHHLLEREVGDGLAPNVADADAAHLFCKRECKQDAS